MRGAHANPRVLTLLLDLVEGAWGQPPWQVKLRP